MAVKYTLDKLKDIKHDGNRLTVIDYDMDSVLPSGQLYKKVICLCDCGVKVSVSMYHYIHGKTKSCGCYRVDSGRRFQKYHPIVPGIYSSYKGMLSRCYDTSHKSYRNYGGRGVVVCEEWKNDYQAFLDWAIQNGWQESLELDKDTKGDGMVYSPQTCCWVTKLENNRIRKDTKMYIYNGELLTVSEISRKTKIPYTTLVARIKRSFASV